MIAPIVSGMKGVEKQKLNYLFEYLCILRYLNKLDSDAATAMLQTYSDLDQYHNLIGREVNLRWEDSSGAAKNPGALRYIRRMFGPEGDQIVERINGENLALNIMSHMILPMAESLLEAFGERLKIIEVVRHPLYMVTHWHAYLSRFEGPREFTLSFEIEGHKVPWFAADWYEEYVKLSITDRILASIVRLYERLFKVIDEMDQREQPLLVTSFEQVVLDPEPVLKQLEQFLGRAHNPRLNIILRKQKLPRERITHGKGNAAYGWQAGIESSERDEYEKLTAFIQTSGSDKYLDLYAKLITEYNQRWPSELSQFH